MGTETKIEWATHTWNPWSGCAKVSAGCANCYAEALDNRWHKGEHWGRGAPRKRASDATLRLPLKWNREAEKTGVRPRVFCLSMGDWLDPEVPIQWLYDLLDMVRLTPNLDWLLLTKRPELWREKIVRVLSSEINGGAYIEDEVAFIKAWIGGKPPSNVWVGTSLESPKYNDRIRHLLAIPATVRFLSCEPLLEMLLLPDVADLNTGIHWVIVGGESGPKARPCNWVWIELLVGQCILHEVPVFVKQLGANVRGPDNLPLKLRDSKGGDMSEWPDHLRVREFPEQNEEGGMMNEEVKGGRDE